MTSPSLQPSGKCRVSRVATHREAAYQLHPWDGDFGVAFIWLEGGFGPFPDRRKGRSGNIAMADFGLSAFAMFFIQCASFLSFQRTLEKGQGRSNCQTLFGIKKIPSDNYIRDMLDEADPARLAPCFERAEHLLRGGAMREALAGWAGAPSSPSTGRVFR